MLCKSVEQASPVKKEGLLLVSEEYTITHLELLESLYRSITKHDHWIVPKFNEHCMAQVYVALTNEQYTGCHQIFVRKKRLKTFFLLFKYTH